MKINWDDIRKKEFPALENMIYLKAAGGSPISKTAYQYGIQYFDEMLNLGDIVWEKYFDELNSIRKGIAKYINSKPEEIAFLINTSSCMNIAARILKVGKLIYPEHEFPSSIHIFKRLGFNCKKIKHFLNKYQIETIRKELSNNTQYLVHSHVQYLTGFRQDLGQLGKFCSKNNLTNIINATQSFGAFPIDVQKYDISILVASALKWACCGYGIGILYVKNIIVKENDLPVSSWLSVENPFNMNNDNLDIIKKTSSMDGLGGTPNFPALLTLKGGLKLIENIGQGDFHAGINAIHKRIINLTSEFLSKAKELNYKIITPLEIENRSGIITVEHDKAPLIFEELVKNNIYSSLRNYPDSSKKTLLRFSFHYYNNLEDIEKAVNVLKRF